MRRILLTAALALCWAAPLAAQGDPLRPGARVRVQTQAGVPLVGTLERLTVDSLSWVAERTGRLRVIPLDSLRRVEVSRGRPSRARKALFGAVIGGAVGTAMGMAYASGCDNASNGTCRDRSATTARLGLQGAALAGVLGYFFPGSERWRQVQVPIPPPPAPGQRTD